MLNTMRGLNYDVSAMVTKIIIIIWLSHYQDVPSLNSFGSVMLESSLHILVVIFHTPHGLTPGLYYLYSRKLI